MNVSITRAVVLLGASTFPQAPTLTANPAFLNSKHDFRDYVQDKQFGLGIPDERVLDLFDTRVSSSEVIVEIGKFLDRIDQERAPDGLMDLVVYYVGHGIFAGIGQSYFLALFSTLDRYESATALNFTQLAEVIKEHASRARHFIFLDSCFAGHGVADFQSQGQQVAAKKAASAFQETLPSRPVAVPRRGTALFCAASKTNYARAPSGHRRTMFSDALLTALHTGDELEHRSALTLADLEQLTWQQLRKHQEPVRPEIHSPNQIDGDIARLVPLFPNRGHQEPTENVAVPPVAVKDSSPTDKEAPTRKSRASTSTAISSSGHDLTARLSSPTQSDRRRIPPKKSSVSADRRMNESPPLPADPRRGVTKTLEDNPTSSNAAASAASGTPTSARRAATVIFATFGVMLAGLAHYFVSGFFVRGGELTQLLLTFCCAGVAGASSFAMLGPSVNPSTAGLLASVVLVVSIAAGASHMASISTFGWWFVSADVFIAVACSCYVPHQPLWRTWWG